MFWLLIIVVFFFLVGASIVSIFKSVGDIGRSSAKVYREVKNIKDNKKEV